MSKPIITQARLKEIFSYNPETGVFIWVNPTSNRVKKGSVAGTLNSMGYICIGIDGPQYLAHKLAYLYIHNHYGKEIDHIDHISTNNRINNLRTVSHTENGRNQKLRSTNTSGFNGVNWDSDRNKWVARIRHDRKTIHLGRFDNIDDAISIRKEANVKYGYHKNHGMS